MPAWLVTVITNLLIKLGMAILAKFIPGISPGVKQAMSTYHAQKEDLKDDVKLQIKTHIQNGG